MFKFKKAIVAAAAGMSIMIALTGCGAEKKTQINTTDGITNILDYVTVDFSGRNGEGTAFVNVDYDGMETEMVGGKEKIEELDELGDLTELTKYINAVSSISVSIDKNKELSNGDEVVVSVTYDETAAQSAGVVFGEEKDRSFKVEGLKK
ncbi:MAG: hypothetical protein IKO79_05935 [Butyrivibrio sp.]|nr:hypothetical protein [Butyrivibrio sp.]